MGDPFADDAVALTDGVVEAGQLLAARGGFDPQTKLADLNRFCVHVHTFGQFHKSIAGAGTFGTGPVI